MGPAALRHNCRLVDQRRLIGNERTEEEESAPDEGYTVLLRPAKTLRPLALLTDEVLALRRRQRRLRPQPRRRRQATLGLIGHMIRTPKAFQMILQHRWCREFGWIDFLGSPAATPRLSSETPVAFDRRPATGHMMGHKMNQTINPIQQQLRPPGNRF